MLPKITFIDIETTGASPYKSKVLEIGAIVTENLKIVDTINTVIDPQSHIPEWIQDLTSISEDDILSAPVFELISPKLSEALENSIFVAHNVNFDYKFIKMAYKDLGQDFQCNKLCSVKMFKHFYKQRRGSLDAVIQHLEIPCENRHRAYDDAKVVYDLFLRIKEEYGAKHLKESIKKLTEKPRKVNNYIIRDLPESSGVYIFYNKDNQPLYVGKSNNIKNRVASHFAEARRSNYKKDMINMTNYVDFVPTIGEFGALVKEADMIKRLSPIFNRKLKRKKSLAYLEIEKNEGGYYRVKSGRSNYIHPEKLDKITAVFVTKKAANDFLDKAYREKQLCAKLLGLEKYDNKPCFGHQLGRCSGACANKVNANEYNKSFMEIFEKVTYLKWPFESAICIIEKTYRDEPSEITVIDKWCFLGTFKEYELQDKINIEQDLVFDYDFYKITRSFLKNMYKEPVTVAPLDEVVKQLSNSF